MARLGKAFLTCLACALVVQEGFYIRLVSILLVKFLNFKGSFIKKRKKCDRGMDGQTDDCATKILVILLTISYTFLKIIRFLL